MKLIWNPFKGNKLKSMKGLLDTLCGKHKRETVGGRKQIRVKKIDGELHTVEETVGGIKKTTEYQIGILDYLTLGVPTSLAIASEPIERFINKILPPNGIAGLLNMSLTILAASLTAPNTILKSVFVFPILGVSNLFKASKKGGSSLFKRAKKPQNLQKQEQFQKTKDTHLNVNILSNGSPNNSRHSLGAALTEEEVRETEKTKPETSNIENPAHVQRDMREAPIQNIPKQNPH